MYEETDSPDPEGEYYDEDNDLVHLDNGARVPNLRGAVGDHSVGFPCHRDLIMELTGVTGLTLYSYKKHILSVFKISFPCSY